MDGVRFVLRLNVATCAGFGLLFLLATHSVSNLLGSFPILALQILGVGLLLHSLHLLFASLRKKVILFEVYYFSAGDILWFLGSLLILVGTGFVSTIYGAVVTILVGTLVAGIGLAQLWFLFEAEENTDQHFSTANEIPETFDRIQAVGFSWMRMKTWIKIWLFALNAVFLFALFYWPSELAQIVLAAYFASAPLLLAFVIAQRGLTRLLSIAHLIPWLPLMAYLVLRLTSDMAGVQTTPESDSGLFAYTVVLTLSVAVCLAFDFYDLVRWLRGDRARIGSLMIFQLADMRWLPHDP